MQDASTVSTGKIYYRDAYVREFEARVLSVSGRDIVLDRTAFFPEEGGQEPDTGTLAGIPVTDVQIADGEIHHYLSRSAEGIDIGAVVEGKIDWDRRFSNMQQHSGEHLLSGLISRKYGFDNVGFHLSRNEVTLDFNGAVPAEDIPELERTVNRLITSDIETVIYMTSKEERENMKYRSKLDLDGEVRIVEFPGADACACCAPHVRRTGEIGLLKITGMINYKGGVRLSILCGERAFRFLQEEHTFLTDTANYLTTSTGEVYSQAVRMKEEIRTLKAGKSALAGKLLSYQAKSIPADAENALLFTEAADMKAVRDIVNDLAGKHSGYAAVFCGSDETGYTFVIGSAEMDAREALERLKRQFGARGGGSKSMVQGSLRASEAEIRGSGFAA